MPAARLRGRPESEIGQKTPSAEILLKVAHRVAEGENLDEQLASLVEMAVEVLGADRGTLFLNDPETHELYSRVAQGSFRREIRILSPTGIAGHAFSSGRGDIVEDAYSDIDALTVRSTNRRATGHEISSARPLRP